METLKSRAKKNIAQGALTNSKHWMSLVEDIYPTHIINAKGCFLYDESGEKYIDFICGLGANILGYGNEYIINTLKDNLSFMGSHSLPTDLEIRVAESLKTMFPFAEKVKFLKTGSEATSAAVRFARAYTGRNLVLSEGYHGWADEFVSLTSPSSGVPKRDWIKKLDPISYPQQFKDEIPAAIIVEPVITNWDNQRIAWLRDLRRICDEQNIVLIFDEIITGMRFLKYSVYKNYAIKPDLLVIGKSIANGMPLSAVLGSSDILDNPKAFVSSTFAGDTLSLVACLKVLELIRYEQRYEIEYLWDKGLEFIDKFNSFDIKVKLEGYPTRGILVGSDYNKAVFMQQMARANILFHKSWFLNWDLLEQLDLVYDALKNFELELKLKKIKLEGKMPISPFAHEVRYGNKSN